MAAPLKLMIPFFQFYERGDVSMVVSRGPSHKLPELRVRTGAEAPGRVAGESGDLDRCIAWAFLELWEQKHRAMGEILRAILEEERAYWSTVRW